ncbi:MAG: SDR family oxidoreductase [Methanomicrobiales archaeon]|nr:SDR family oxidoreductase [Methanomicrobiales archaeon]
MHYLITRGSGFIGSHLAERLYEDHAVTVLDDLSTGRIENIQHLVTNGSIIFVQGSVFDLPLLKTHDEDIDGIFHEAAIPSVVRSVRDPQTSHAVNCNGTLNILIAARDLGVRRVVYAPSSSVYGDTPKLPKKEDMPPNPKSPYAIAKLTGKHYARVFSELYGLSTASLRYFNVYGPRQDPASEYAAVVPRFITRALRGEPPIIYGDGHQTRDFTYVGDVVDANVDAMESTAEGAFNIACGHRTDLLSLAATIMAVIGTKLDPIHEPPRPGDIQDSLADITAARDAFGFSHQYTVEEGVQETVAWYRENYI